MLTKHLRRVPIAHLPTPLEKLTRLTEQLAGPELWIKRDDETGLATGGNKARKLEFLLADALAQDAYTIVTGGAAQSNHARQTAAAAAMFGLRCALVLRGEAPDRAQGNLLLDHLLGARIVWAGERPLDEVMDAVGRQLEDEGRRPYIVPYGGSNPTGASGYVAAIEELLGQCAERDVTFDAIVFPSSSGGTQAGMAVGATALDFAGSVLGVSVDLAAADLRRNVAQLATATAEHLGLTTTFTPEMIDATDAYVGGGYGVVSDLEQEAMRTLARSQGILLDPVYTARAFGGLLDMIRTERFRTGERVLFWHTGGTSGIFGYGERCL